MYYLRTRPSVDPIKFTVDKQSIMKEEKKVCNLRNEDGTLKTKEQLKDCDCCSS